MFISADTAVSLKTKDERIVLFWAHGRSGRVMVDGVVGDSLDYFDEITDAVIFQQTGRVFLALAVSRDLCRGSQYDLEVCHQLICFQK